MDRLKLVDSLPAMTKTTIAPRIVPSSEMEASSVDLEWSDQEHEPRMFGMSGGLSVSGGDFGFEIPAAEPDESDHE